MLGGGEGLEGLWRGREGGGGVDVNLYPCSEENENGTRKYNYYILVLSFFQSRYRHSFIPVYLPTTLTLYLTFHSDDNARV